MTGDSVISRLAWRNNKVMEYDDHTTNDIIETLEKYHPVDRPEYDRISDSFWQGNVKDTARGLFDFLKKNVRYKEEPDSYQTSKSPGALLHQGYGDCKHYSAFITGVCDSLHRKGYPINSTAYRFVSDTPNKDVHHVFAVVSGGGQTYWVDPVLQTFDQRPTFYNIKSKTMGGIGAIYRLSGAAVGTMERMDGQAIQTFLHRHGAHPGQFKSAHHMARFIHSHLMNSGTLNEPRQVFQAGLVAGIGKKKAHGNFLKAIAHGASVNLKNIKHGMDVNAANAKKVVLKVGLAAGRGPFLTLVDMNAFNVAHQLHDQLLSSNRNELLSKWSSIGGKPSALIAAVNNGYREYKKHHGGYNMQRDKITGLGVVQVAALMALAAGIFGLLAKFIHHTPKDAADAAAAIADGTSQLVGQATAALDPDGNPIPGFTPPGNMPAMDVSTGVDANGNPVLSVSSVSHPAMLNDNGVPQGVPLDQGGGSTDDGSDQVQSSSDNAAVVAPGGDVTTTVATDAEGDVKNIFARIEAFVKKEKVPLIAAGAALLLLKNKKVRRKFGF